MIDWKGVAFLRMKGGKRWLTTPLLITLFIVVSLGAFLVCRERIKNEYYAILGEASQDMATLLAGQFELTDADVESLKSTPYAELPDSPLNKRLLTSVGNTGEGLPIKFVYLICRLDESEIPESVMELEEHPGEIPEIMYLLDAFGVTDEQTAALLESGEYYDEHQRYDVIHEWHTEALGADKPGYMYASDEWGETVTGYAPVYTQEGAFVGALCVDVYADEVVKHARPTVFMMVAIYLITTLMLCGMFFLLYQKYFKVRQQQLYIDPLTNAYNRRYLNELFKKSLNIKKYADEHLALVMLDIDDFKKVNDSYGHDSGDMCLQQIAHAIADVLKRPPNVLIRYGGEEFLAAITVDNGTQARKEITDILEGVRKLKLFPDGRKVTVSGGAALLPYADIEKTDITFVIKEADDNCYYSKRNGKDQFKLTDFSLAHLSAKDQA